MRSMKRTDLSAWRCFSYAIASRRRAGKTRHPFSRPRRGARYWMQPDIVYDIGEQHAAKARRLVSERRSKTRQRLWFIFTAAAGYSERKKERSSAFAVSWNEAGASSMSNTAWRAIRLLPAAVEDTRCALRWVFRNAKQWNFDTSKIVLTGHSAGGHLSLITGMLPDGHAARQPLLRDEKYGDVRSRSRRSSTGTESPMSTI